MFNNFFLYTKNRYIINNLYLFIIIDNININFAFNSRVVTIVGIRRIIEFNIIFN